MYYPKHSVLRTLPVNAIYIPPGDYRSQRLSFISSGYNGIGENSSPSG
jgi:hypothetical protein